MSISDVLIDISDAAIRYCSSVHGNRNMMPMIRQIDLYTHKVHRLFLDLSNFAETEICTFHAGLFWTDSQTNTSVFIGGPAGFEAIRNTVEAHVRFVNFMEDEAKDIDLDTAPEEYKQLIIADCIRTDTECVFLGGHQVMDCIERVARETINNQQSEWITKPKSSSSSPAKKEFAPKTKQCRYFQSGHCKKGDECTFIHE